MRTALFQASAALAGASLLLAVASLPAQEQALRSALQAQAEATESNIRDQDQIERLADETADLLSDYRLTLQSLDRVRIYNRHLEEIVEDQEAEKARMGQRLDNYQRTKREIIPLMVSMIDSLEQFVEADLPFQLEQRRATVQRLRELLDDSEVTISEKYRQLMQAYQSEMDIGRNVEAYVAWLGEGEARREVDFLRVGRVVLAYQTRDGTETGYWDRASGSWQPLGEQYREYVTEGLRIARKQAAPQLLRLPVVAAETAP